MASSISSRFLKPLKQYGEAALVTHGLLYLTSLAGFYVAVKNDIDIKISIRGEVEKLRRNSEAEERLLSSGGAFALAYVCNRATLPVRIPITIALTHPVARFLARRSITCF